ncbi:hypothetical protein PFISCL1PPCAC_23168, partial [Pristionchus fissidentatus]
QLPYLNLETLPKENLYQILSTLPMRNRRVLRQGSKTMKAALEQIDLNASRIDLDFYWDEILTMTFHGSDDVYKLQACVMDWAIRSSVPINSLALDNCSLDPEVILIGYHKHCSTTRYNLQKQFRFTDSDILAIARIGHGNISLPIGLSKIGTIRTLIGVVHSSDYTLEFALEVKSVYFRRFLESVNLREEGSNLQDVTNTDAPVIWGQINYESPFYYLDYGYGYLKVFSYRAVLKHTVSIVKGEKPRDLGPSHPLILP